MEDNCSYLVSQSAVYEWVINVVRIENHLLHPVVAPALHELAELFEGDPIPGKDHDHGDPIPGREGVRTRTMMMRTQMRIKSEDEEDLLPAAGCHPASLVTHLK